MKMDFKKSKLAESISLWGYLRQTLIIVVPLAGIYSLFLGMIIGLTGGRLMILILANIIISAGLVLLASTKNFKRYVSPATKAIQILKNITGLKDFTQRIQTGARGEFFELEAQLNQFLDMIQETLYKITDAVKSLNQSSGLFLKLSDSMASVGGEASTRINAAGDTASRITQDMDKTVKKLAETGEKMSVVAAAVEEMTATIFNLAAVSEETSASTDEISDIAAQINEKVANISGAANEVSGSVNNVATSVKEMNASLNEVSQNCERSILITTDAEEKAKNTNNIIDKLNHSSLQIGKIVNVINDIADQTNMLALNAAIEAAGAGEAGKGFAVVANEVKDLAKQTAEATDEISQQIETMQVNTTEAVKAVEVISGVIREITSITGTIAAAVAEQSATTGEISKSTIRAAERVNLITQDMNTVAGNMQNVTYALSDASKGVKEIAHAASEISSASNEAASNTEEASGKIQEVIKTTGVVQDETQEISYSMDEARAASDEIAKDALQVHQSAKELANDAAILEGFVKQFRIV